MSHAPAVTASVDAGPLPAPALPDDPLDDPPPVDVSRPLAVGDIPDHGGIDTSRVGGIGTHSSSVEGHTRVPTDDRDRRLRTTTKIPTAPYIRDRVDKINGKSFHEVKNMNVFNGVNYKRYKESD